MVVPVIAVLTKYEALIDRVKDRAKERGGRPVTKNDVMSYLDESVLCPIKRLYIRLQPMCKYIVSTPE